MNFCIIYFVIFAAQKNINYEKILQVFLIALIFSSCSNVIVPYYTTVDKITEVDPGMSKDQVVETLGIAPYEIFHGIEGGCEIHQFKYKHKEISHGTLNSYSSNNNGVERFVDPSNLYIYYRDGKVESLVTDAGKKGGSMVLSFAKELQSACDGPEPEVVVYGINWIKNHLIMIKTLLSKEIHRLLSLVQF